MRKQTYMTWSLVLATTFVLAGCDSGSSQVKAPPPPANNATAMQAKSMISQTRTTFRSSLQQSLQNIDNTSASLAALTNPGQTDLRGAYDAYCNNLAVMQQHAEQMRTEAEAMRATRGNYFQNWESKATDINNPNIRESAEWRRTSLRAANERITTDSLAARDAYVPYMNDLQDIRKYLAQDLSRASLADIGTSASKSQASAAALKQRITAVIQDLDAVNTGQ